MESSDAQLGSECTWAVHTCRSAVGAGVIFHEGFDALDVGSLGKGLVEDHHCRYADQIGAVASATSEAEGVVRGIKEVKMSVSRWRAVNIYDEAEIRRFHSFSTIIIPIGYGEGRYTGTILGPSTGSLSMA